MANVFQLYANKKAIKLLVPQIRNLFNQEKEVLLAALQSKDVELIKEVFFNYLREKNKAKSCLDAEELVPTFKQHVQRQRVFVTDNKFPKKLTSTFFGTTDDEVLKNAARIFEAEKQMFSAFEEVLSIY